MNIYTSRAGKARNALLACASMLALAFTSQAAAQTSTPSVQVVRQSMEIANGRQVTSVSRDMLVARKRVGDRSLLLYDRQNGAKTVEAGGEVAIQTIAGAPGIDASFAYDYSTQTFSGDAASALTFNTFFRPIVQQAPRQGADATWTVSTSLGAIGVDRAPGNLTLNLSRIYLQVDGKQTVLFEYEIPAFQYRTPGDETVVHWARGFALTDADFSTVYAVGTQHRASMLEADGEMRPVSYRTSMHGVEKAGGWSINLQQAPRIAAAIARVQDVSGEAERVHLVADVGDAPEVDAFPVMLARYLDMMALAAAEGGANPLPATYGASTQPDFSPSDYSMGQVYPPKGPLGNPAQFPNVGRTPETPQERQERLEQEESNEAILNDPYGLRDDAPSQTPIKRVRVRRNDGQPAAPDTTHSGSSNPLLTRSTTGASELIRAQVLYLDLLKGDASLPAADRQKLESERNVRADMLRDLNRVINNDYSTMPINPDYDKQTYRTAPEFGLNNFWNDNPWITGTDPDGAPPAWIEPSSADAATYRELIAYLEQSIAEINTRLDRDFDGGSGDKSIDDFYANNAYDYMSMVGIIETDLSRWGEWLATQNVRELNRLALLAGYPNLASALADAENLIRQSQDPGYRHWAMQAPSCNGLAGCGPSYLERWWMKQSVVALGDILAESRDIFSTGGFSDIGISGLNLNYLLRDHSLEDGDIVQVKITQFGRTIYQGQVNLTNLGEVFNQQLGRGVASLEIFAVNEGYSPPNTAQVRVDNVVRGQGTQTYSLRTGETATLRIEAGAVAGAPGGTP